jgi:serine/threonine protein kinase
MAGGTLSEKIKSKSLSIEEATKYFGQLVYALDYIHKNDVVHRDLKPDNILISPKGVLIADFGAATAEIPKTIIGTKDYMAFEIRKAADEDREEEFTSKTDVYSLGKIAYEMFNGKLPSINYRDERDFPIHSEDKVPPAIKNLYSKMLKKNPLDRPSMR